MEKIVADIAATEAKIAKAEREDNNSEAYLYYLISLQNTLTEQMKQKNTLLANQVSTCKPVTAAEIDPVEAIYKITGKEMTPSEINCLFNSFPNHARLVSQNWFKGNVFGLYHKIVTTVKSITKQSVVHTGYFFDELLPNAHGQGNTVLQYVHYHCQLLCAKIGPPADMRSELTVSDSVHLDYNCPTVMRILAGLELPKDRLALVCPHYPVTVAILPPGNCTLAMMCNVALCTLASIAAFRRVNMSHNDIKPANLMLTTTSQLIVLIDFGSAVEIGAADTTKGTTPLWGRDCPPGSYGYDMACLGSVLFHLQHGELHQEGEGLRQLAAYVQRLPSRTIVDEMILDCINRAETETSVLFAEWKSKVDSVRESLEAGTLVDSQAIWPAPKGGQV